MGELWLGAVALGWSIGVVLLWRVRTLPPSDPDVATGARPSVVIPARNEAASLPVLLASLEAQVPPPLEVVVVDDGSDDATVAVAEAAGARVVPAGDVPAGWLGKPWACQRGVAETTGEHLVFLDADTWLAPDGLARLVTAQAAQPEGLLSVQPYHLVRRPHEQLSALANIVPVLASGMALPWARSTTVAFGPCMTTTRPALASVGGWAATSGSITEDLALAQAFRADGRTVRCLGGGRTVRFRMYPDGLASLVEGWTKNLAVGARHASVPLVVAAVAWVASLAAVAAHGLGVIGGWLTGGPAPTVALAVVWSLVSLQVWWMLRRLGSFHPWTAVAFPVPLAAFVGLFVRSSWLQLLGRSVMWRGRQVPTRRDPAPPAGAAPSGQVE